MTPVWQKYKYSLVETERRFLLERLPKDLDLGTFRLIEDRYVPETRLRLRKITNETGETLELKLTQKFVASAKSEERVITNMYLNETEYALFDVPGYLLKKRRYRYDMVYALDVFEGPLSGLMLAEVEVTEDKPLKALPDFALKEVTLEPFFTGGNLARLSREQFLAGLHEYLAYL
jgi:CYTH domain-containing protein